MDGDNTPGPLDAELFEEGCGDDGAGGRVCVGVEESTAEDGYDNYGEATTKYLGTVTDQSTTGHSTEIGDNLNNGYSVCGEIVLIFKHGWVEILGTMRLDLS